MLLVILVHQDLSKGNLVKIHAVQTGDVLVKSAFLGSPVHSGGIVPYMASLFIDRTYIRLPILTWVIEHHEGTIVVDTGSLSTIKQSFMTRARFDIAPEAEIGVQLKRMGIDQVSKVVLTHLHGDHIDGLKYFEHTPVWVGEREYAPFQNPKGGFLSKIGAQLPEWFSPNLIKFRQEKRGSFDSYFPLTEDGTVFAVPTPGHSIGHLSVVAVIDGIHYFIAGDVTYYQRSLLSQKIEGPVVAASDHRQTLQHVHDYVEQYPTVYLPSHDPESVKRLMNHEVAVMNAVSVPA
jgi:N-acyl homoserine lactone hydrolase